MRVDTNLPKEIAGVIPASAAAEAARFDGIWVGETQHPPTARSWTGTAGGILQPELTRLSKEGRWADMGDAIDDEILSAFAVVGDPVTVGKGLRDRWSPLASRITLYAPYAHDPAVLALVADAARG